MKIGVFIGDIDQTYSAIVLHALEEYAKEHEITLHIFGCFGTPEKKFLHAEGEKSIIYIQNLQQLDGIIIAGDTLGHFGMKEALLARLEREAGCPVVCLRAREDAYYNVLIDNVESMYEMTNHFIREHGFVDICFVTGIMTMRDAKERLEGYRKAMQEAGLLVRDDMIFYGNYWMDQGVQIVDQFTRGRDSLPSAIICSNDYMAMSVCDELEKRGIRVPQDICVSGFDDLSETGSGYPSFTSVYIPFAEMAQKAIEMVEALAKGIQVEQYQAVRGQLRLRESCGCCRDDAHIMREESSKFRIMAKECIYMTTDMESALNEKECLEWAGWHTRRLGAQNCFICVKDNTVAKPEDGNMPGMICLKYYMDEKGDSVFPCMPIPEQQLLPDALLPQLENRVNLFLPLHYNNEVYGYCIFQLEPGETATIDERYEFFCMNLSNALKKNQMYQELFSVKDVMEMYLKDPLTNLYNRRGFERKLLEVCEISQRTGKRLAVVSIDMDGLKYINDHFGHLTGDECLVSLSRCLDSVLGEDEFCARMGGDEFSAILLLDGPDRIDRFEKQLFREIAVENEKITGDYEVDASIGICEVEKNDCFMEYIRRADEKMYRIKRGKKRCRQ